MSRSAIARLTEELQSARDIDTVRRSLIRSAPAFRDALTRRTLVGQRRDLELRVQSSDGGSSGMTLRDGGNLVFLRRDEGTPRRRLTLAHELAHHLLRPLDRDAVPLTHDLEEELCELFAEHALMPSRLVACYLNEVGVPRTPADVFDFCRHFGVSLSAAIRRIDRHLPPEPQVALLTATYRRRANRDEDTDFRIDASAATSPLFLPRHQRLASCRLDSLRAWATEARLGDEASGWETNAEVRSQKAGVSGYVGPVNWGARALNPPRPHSTSRVAIMAVLDTSGLEPRMRRARMPGIPRGVRSTPNPYQLAFGS